MHWGALHWRFLPTDFRIRSALTSKYGARAIPDAMAIQDWPLSYDEIEPCYDRFDKLCGVSGQAGNFRGQLIEGGNPFEGPRSDDYPNKPIKTAAGPRCSARRPAASAIIHSRCRRRRPAPLM
jgi:gluconate 2-dehydrogenase alpha chain